MFISAASRPDIVVFYFILYLTNLLLKYIYCEI